MFSILSGKKIASLFLLFAFVFSISSCADPFEMKEQPLVKEDIIMVINISGQTGIIEEADLVILDTLETWGYSVVMVEQEELE